MGRVMSAPRLYLDANIFILAFENTNDVSEKVFELISLNENATSHFLATSELTLAELMVEPLRKQDIRLIEIYENLTIGNALIQIGPVNREILWRAAQLRAENQSLHLPDAIHVATALSLGCRYLLSADKRLKDAYSLVPNRHVLPALNAEIVTVRPDALILDSILSELTT
jgi:predicted nucleic acid-binding protein